MATINRFPLSSEECELLLEFESIPSLSELAARMGRDYTVIARTLKKLSQRFPVVEKKAGKWVLTETGKAINENTKAALSGQISVLNEHSMLRIGTNREFATRVIGPDFRRIQGLFPRTELTINTYENGCETPLLRGQIDIGIDCERPYDPYISYKLVIEESIVAVATKSFLKRFERDMASRGMAGLPHLLCDRLHPDKILSMNENQLNVAARFNDIATTRMACTLSVGWALLPLYAVADELQRGRLVKIDEKIYGKTKYGVWWLRGHPYLEQSCSKLITWLRSKSL